MSLAGPAATGGGGGGGGGARDPPVPPNEVGILGFATPFGLTAAPAADAADVIPLERGAETPAPEPRIAGGAGFEAPGSVRAVGRA